MNNKFIRAAAVVVICLFSGKVVKDEIITIESLRLYIGILMAIIAILRFIVTKRNKTIILDRRRLIKDMRRRAYLVDEGKANWERMVKKDEELILQLLGTTISSIPTLIFFILGVGIALVLKWDLFALIFTLGSLFLVIEFYFAGRLINRRLAPDSTRNYPDTDISISANYNYLLRINLEEVKSFTILPPGTVFWTNQKVIEWLKKCGFRRDQDKLWMAKGSALKALDSNEIISITQL